MKHTDLLRKRRSLRDAHVTAPEDSALSGPSLMDQEPDLAKEAGQHTRDASGWAAGGQPPD